MASRTSSGTHSQAQAFDLDRYLGSTAEAVNAALDRFLPKASTRPPTIHRAMRYSLLAPAKRVRPIITVLAAEQLGYADRFESTSDIANQIASLVPYNLPLTTLSAFNAGIGRSHGTSTSGPPGCRISIARIAVS